MRLDSYILQERHQLAPGQITRATKNHNNGREYFHIDSLNFPLGVKRAFGIETLVGVSPEIVALGLDEIGR